MSEPAITGAAAPAEAPAAEALAKNRFDLRPLALMAAIASR